MSLLAAIGLLLPIGIAAAFSTIPVATATAILLSGRARRNGVAYLIGLAGGSFLVTLALAFGLGHLPPAPGIAQSPLLAIIELVLGVLLIGYGVFAFVHGRHRKPDPAQPKPPGRWARTIDKAPLWTALAAGIIMAFRPKALLLSVAAGVAITKADIEPGEGVIAVAIYTVIAASTVAVPVIYMLIDQVRATRWLQSAKGFLALHGRILTLVVCALIGAVLIGDGLIRL